MALLDVPGSAAIYPSALISDLLQLRLSDFLDRRGDNRRRVFRMTKLQMHASTNKAAFQHGTSPGRACDRDLDWFWAIQRMPRDKWVLYRGSLCMLTMDCDHDGQQPPS